MGDSGDFWKDVNTSRREYREHCHPCPDCKKAFGTGKLIGPGQRCPHHRWLAPNVSSKTGKPWKGLKAL